MPADAHRQPGLPALPSAADPLTDPLERIAADRDAGAWSEWARELLAGDQADVVPAPPAAPSARSGRRSRPRKPR